MIERDSQDQSEVSSGLDLCYSLSELNHVLLQNSRTNSDSQTIYPVILSIIFNSYQILTFNI